MGRFVKHESCPACGSRDNVGVWDDGGKYCFGCHWIAYPNFAARLQNLEAHRYQQLQSPLDNNGDEIIELPADCTDELPASIYNDLCQYLTPQEIKACQIGWSETEERWIFPIFDKNQYLVYWTGKYCGNDKRTNAKYWSEGSREEACRLFGDNHYSNRVVFVEDLLSAVVVGRVAPAVAILGSKIPLGFVRKLSSRFKGAVVWLDKDKRKESLLEALELNSWFPEGVKVVFSGFDPKCYNRTEVEKFLGQEVD